MENSNNTNIRFDRIEATLESFIKEFSEGMNELRKAQMQNEFQIAKREQQHKQEMKDFNKRFAYFGKLLEIYGEGLSGVEDAVEETAEVLKNISGKC